MYQSTCLGVSRIQRNKKMLLSCQPRMTVTCLVNKVIRDLYSYFMPVCSIVETNTPRCRGRPDALLHEAEGRVQ